MDQNYYANKLATLTAGSENTKKESLVEAFNRKLDSIGQYVEAKEKKKAQTVTGILENTVGITQDSFLGNVVNKSVRLGNAFSQFTGKLPAAIHDLEAAGILSNVPNEAIKARQREVAGTATPEDIQLLSAKQPTGGTHKNRLLAAEGAQKNAEYTRKFFDLSSAVDNNTQDEMLNSFSDQASSSVAKIEEGFNDGLSMKSGAISKMLSGAVELPGIIFDTATRNPDAAVDFFIDSVPDTLAAAAGVVPAVASNILYGLDVFGKGVNARVEKNKALPASDETLNIAKNAAIAAGLETVGDIASGITKLNKLTKKQDVPEIKVIDPVEKVAEVIQKTDADKVADEIISTPAFKKLLQAAGSAVPATGKVAKEVLTSSPTKVVSATTKGAGSEFFTEALQTNYENNAEDKETTLMEAVQGGAVGAMTGGTIRGGIETLIQAPDIIHKTGEVLKNTQDYMAKAAEKSATTAAETALVEKAVEEKNPDLLLDTKSEAFNPVKAISVMSQLNQQEDITPEERTKYQDKTKSVISSVQQEIEALKGFTSEGRQEQLAELESMKARLASLAPEDTKRRTMMEGLIGAQEKALSDPLPAEAEQVAIKQKIKEKQSNLAEAQNLYDSMLIESASESVKGVDPKVLLQEANYDVTTPVAEADAPAFEQTKVKAQEAVKKSVLLSMVSPDTFTAEDAMQLASNTKNVLTDTERKYFTTYAEAVNSENKLKSQEQVHKEVLYGDPNLDQKGLVTYKERVNRYLSARDFSAADKELMGLTRFVASHTAKAQVFTSAMKTFDQNGAPLKVMKTKDNTWEYSKLLPSEDPKEIKKMGGYTIAGNSRKLVSQVNDEAQALTKGYEALESAYSLMQGTKTSSTTATATTAPVTNTPVTQPAQPVTTSAGSEVSQSLQIAPVSFVNSTATTKEETNGTQTPQAVQTKAQESEATATNPSTATTQAAVTTTAPLVIGGVKLENNNPKHLEKDQAKADQATKFIGRGSKNSSTASYAAAFGERANSGNYTSDDVVFISANGNRPGRVEPDFNEIDLAIKAGASFITDVPAQRNTSFNKVGEGKVAEYLVNSGYTEYEPGKWKPTEISTTPVITETTQDLTATAAPEELSVDIPTESATEFESSVNTEEAQQVKTESTTAELISAGVNPAAAKAIEANKVLAAEMPTPTVDETGNTIETVAVDTTVEDAVEPVEKPVPKPTLSVLNNTENRASKFLKQVVGIVKGAAANNILVNVPNVLSTIAQHKSTAPIEHLVSTENRTTDIGVLNNIRSELVNPNARLKKEDKKVQPANLPFGANLRQIISNIPVESVEGKNFGENNAINDFLLKKADGTYTLDENVMVAATTAGISFLMDSMGKGLFHTREGLSKLLNLENKDSRPNKEAWTELGEGYVRFSVAAASVGQAVTQMLGLKDTKDAPANYRKNFETAIGSYVLQAMSDSHLINQRIIKDVDFQAMRGKEGITAKPHLQHLFINLSRNGKDRGKLSDKNLAMKKKYTGSSASLNRLFSITPSVEYPSFKPQKFKQRKVKNSTKGVPSVIANTLNQEQQTPLRINKTVWGLYNNLPIEMAQEAIGVDTRPEEQIHIANRMGIQAKNDGLVRGDEHLRDFVMNHVEEQADGLDTPFYAGFEMWNQQRVGQTKAINMQSNKEHRQMIVPDQWNTQVRLKDTNTVNSLKLRVMEAFGVKTDSMLYSDALKSEWDKLESNEAVQKGVEVIQRHLSDPGYEVTNDDHVALLEGIRASKSNLHGLSAMVGYAQYKNAVKEQEANPDADVKFTTQINGEIDGINNGPILFLMAMGVVNLDHFGPKGGFFTSKDGYKNANAWKANSKNLDLYQSLTREVLDQVGNEKLDAKRSALYKSIYYFTGELGDANKVSREGRNMAKGPTTQNAFGSGKGGLLDGMTGSFVGSIHEKIESLWKEKDLKQRDVKTRELVGHLNKIIGASKKQDPNLLIPLDTPLDVLTNNWLPPKIQKELENTFEVEIGQRYVNAMDVMYGEAASKRAVITKNAQAMNDLYVATRAAVKEAYIDQKIKEGVLDANFKDTWDLSSEMEKEIDVIVKHVDPTLRTAASAQEETLEAGIDNGMSIIKSKTKQSEDERYKPTLWSKDWDGKSKGKASARTVTGSQQTIVDPGVGVTVKNTHSLDSSISNTQDPTLGGVNVHDAKITGLENYTAVGRSMNETTYKNLRDYSFMKEFYDSRVRQLKAINKLITTAKPDSIFAHVLRDVLDNMYEEDQKDKNKWNPFDLQELWLTVKEAEFNKQIYLSQLTYVDQYGNEGGEYEVTDADRKVALIKAEEIAGQDVHPTVHELSDKLHQFIGEQYSRMTVYKPANSVPSDSDLTIFFRMNEVTSGKDAVAYIKSMMRRRPNRNKFYEYLLDKIEAALTDNIKIQLVKDPETLPPEKFAPNSRGWSDAEGNIYLLDPRLDNSGLTAELVIHELTHAVLRNIIANPANAIQRKAVHRLTKLMERVAKHANINSMYVDPNALTSVDEFVSWGISNPTFQKEVLGKITFGGRIANALNQFVNSIGELLFGVTSMSANSALAKVLFYSDQLFDEAAKNTNSYRAVNGELLSMVAPQQTFSTKDVFDGLNASNVSSEFNESLRRVMDTVVSNLHGMGGSIKAEIEADTPTALDAWVKAEVTGQRMFVGKVKAANVPFSDRELFVAEQVEAVMGDILKDAAPSNNNAYAELSKLYQQARGMLKGKIDNELYKFVFMPQRGMGNTSDYMGRFVALGLSNEAFNKALGFATQELKLDYKGKPFVERLELTWRALVDWFGARTTNTRMGQAGNDKLAALATKLVQIELNNRSKTTSNKVSEMFEPAQEFISKTLEGAKTKVVELASSQAVRESGVAAVRATGAVVRAVGGAKVGKMIDGLNTIVNNTAPGLPGTARELMNYTKGLGKWVNEVVRTAKTAEKARLEQISDTAKGVVGAFKNGGEYLKPEDQADISRVLLRTGTFTLLDDYGVKGIKEMLEDRAVLKKAIETEFAKLSGFKEQHYYHTQAMALANLRTSGWASVDNLNTNAHGISRLYGTGNTPPAYAEQAKPIIERLVSLYGLRYSEETDGLLQVMRTEANREDGNGIEMTLLTHKQIYEESKERLFDGNESLMFHGYLAEEHNPKTDFVVIRDSDEAAKYEEQGYTFAHSIPLDKNDSDQRPASLYVLRGGGLLRRQTGGISLTGMNAKGKTKHGNYYDPTTAAGQSNMQSMSSIYQDKQAEMNKQFLPVTGFDPRKVTDNKMVPLFNESGEIVDYRYMMKEQVRDNLLERNNDFAHLLGVSKASIDDKVNTRENNLKVMKELRKIYRDGYARNPDNFVRIHHSVQDPELREIWGLIPNGSVKDIQSIWGVGGIYVPKTLVRPLFGQRQASLSYIVDKEKRNVPEQIFFGFAKVALRQYGSMKLKLRGEALDTYSKQVGVGIRRFEDVWQEIVSEIKDTVVVKTFIVFAENVTSNTSILKMHGMSNVDIVNYQVEAFKAVMDYERDRSALAQLKIKMDTGYTQGDEEEIEAEIVRLESELAKNPVKELIDVGLKPTLVEDVNMEDNPYSYKSQLTEWIEENTSTWNKQMLATGKVMYMTHDTTPYKLLSKSTQYSDFIARYALFKHHTTRKKNPLSKADALYEVSEAFVNYDINLPKWADYTDRMGILPFIKYFLSIQRVIYKLVKEHPVDVLSTVLLFNVLGDLTTVIDSSALLRVGNNPLDTGALGYLSSLTDLATLQPALSLIK